MTMLGYFKRCREPSFFPRSGSLTLNLLIERLRNRAEARTTQCLDRASPLSRQDRAQGQMHQHHHPNHCVKPPRTHYIGVVGPPVQLQAAVDPLHRGASLVQPLELLGRAWDRRVL